MTTMTYACSDYNFTNQLSRRSLLKIGSAGIAGLLYSMGLQKGVDLNAEKA